MGDKIWWVFVSRLGSHMDCKHSDEKPFGCPICSKVNKIIILLLHICMKIHTFFIYYFISGLMHAKAVRDMQSLLTIQQPLSNAKSQETIKTKLLLQLSNREALFKRAFWNSVDGMFCHREENVLYYRTRGCQSRRMQDLFTKKKFKKPNSIMTAVL